MKRYLEDGFLFLLIILPFTWLFPNSISWVVQITLLIVSFSFRGQSQFDFKSDKLWLLLLPLVSVMYGMLIDLINGSVLSYHGFEVKSTFVILLIVLVNSKQLIASQRYKIFKAIVVLSSVIALLILAKGVFLAITNNSPVVTNWRDYVTQGFYEVYPASTFNWGELTYKKLFGEFDLHPTYVGLFFAVFSFISIKDIPNIGYVFKHINCSSFGF